jgi:outer membrane lipoprotein-sorting protein
MKKILVYIGILFLPVLSLSAATSTLKSAGDDMFSYIPYASASWDQKSVSVSSGGETTTVDQTVMFKGKKMRMDGVTTVKDGGKVANQLMIMTDKVMYVINKDEKSGTKFSMNSAMNPEKSKTEAAKYRKYAKKTGSETVNGTPCDIYAYSFPVDGSKADGEKLDIKEWRAKDGFVIKTVSEIKGTEVTTVISNIKKNPVLADRLFEVPADVKMIDMDNLMKGLSGAGPADTDNNGSKISAPENTNNGSGDTTVDGSRNNSVGDAAKDEATNDAGNAVKDGATNAIRGLFGQ